MRRRYNWNDILVLTEDLRAFAWSAPMRDLAAQVGYSDVGLKKLLASCGIPAPPQGYWNKVRAGKPVPKCPRAPARRPGETGRVRLDPRFSQVVAPAPPLPSAGPFASPHVPEDLDELFAQELKAMGRVSVPRKLDRAHPGLAQILKQEWRRHEKVAAGHWDAPKFESPSDKRRLRLLNAIFIALTRRGHDGDAYEHDGDIHAHAIVGDTHVGLRIGAAGQERGGRGRRHADQPVARLALVVDPGFVNERETRWRDDDSGMLEAKIASIVAGIIVAGEAKFRRSLRQAEERAEQIRALEERQRQEKLAARNRERLENLHRSGELLRQAEDIRALVARVRQAMVDGSVALDPATMEAWERWACAEADKIDPVRSGQIMSHLREPSA